MFSISVGLFACCQREVFFSIKTTECGLCLMFGWRNDVLILYFVVKNNHLLKVIMLIPFTDHNSPVRSGDLAPPPNFLTSGFFLKIFVGKSKSYDSFTNYISCLALALNSTMCTPSPLGEIGLKFIEVLNIIFLFLCLLS